MKKFVILILSILVSVYVFAHHNSGIDSLYSKLGKTEDSLKAPVLNKLSWELRNSNPEKAIEYGLEAIKLSEKYNDYTNLSKAHSFIGVAYRILGNYSESTDYYYKGLELSKKYGKQEQEGYAYINIGNLHIYQGYYNNAIENLHKALVIAKKTNNKRMLAYVYLNTGRALMLKKNYSEALHNLNIALNLRIETRQVSDQAVCYKYIGDIYYELGNIDKALGNYEKSLKTVDRFSDQDLCAKIYTMFGKAWLKRGNNKRAKLNIEKSMEIARRIGARHIIRDNFKVLSDINIRLQHYESASKDLLCLIKYNDTLFNQQLSEKIFNLEYKFEKQKKQTEIDLLNKDKKIKELELRRTKTFNTALLIILGLILIIFLYVLYTSKQRRIQNNMLIQQKRELDNINNNKDKMFLIISHDIRAPIGNLKTLLEILLENENVKNDHELNESFNVFLKSVQSISGLLENLFFWAKNQRGEVPFTPEVFSLNVAINKVLQLFRSIAEHKNIDINIHIKNNVDVYADKNMILTVIRNLVSNAIKFTPKGGSIKINVKRLIRFNQISIEDSGIGFGKEASEKIFDTTDFYTTTGTNNEIGSGLGLLLCKEFIEKNGGKIWAESEQGKGATFFITIPVIDLQKYNIT